MSTRYIMTITKWLPLEMHEQKEGFRLCKDLNEKVRQCCVNSSSILKEYCVKVTSRTQLTNPNDEFLHVKMQQLYDEVNKTVSAFEHIWQFKTGKGEIEVFKIRMRKEILWKSSLKLVYLLKEILNMIINVFTLSDEMLVVVLRLSTVYNNSLTIVSKFKVNKNASICCNTCPYLTYPSRKISVTRLLQLLVQNRAESCAHKLIDSLLDTYRRTETQNPDVDDSSDDSSLEIYRAITNHMSPPANVRKSSANRLDTGEKTDAFRVQELIVAEQQRALDLLKVTLQVAPQMLGNDALKQTRSGETKVNSRAQKKVLEYYQQVLWGEAGDYLEHIIIWWGTSPLASRPPKSSQHLREWINRFVPTADLPQFVLSSLTTLADALGAHVTSTLWDERFREALVAAKTTCNPETGRCFCEVLQDLVLLCNQFEVTSDWIMGAPLDELPLVEQIPVLHRLDHSVHTTRLWAANETKKIANAWNMAAFFKVTHNDIVNCLSQLAVLRLSDYTLEIEKGGLEVHVEVCAKMRGKLVSEVKENILKLKETPKECIECLANICRTISLANLQIMFPANSYWRQSKGPAPTTPSPYVAKYLNQILNPVLAATTDQAINNMILKLICESWLDHIYLNRIKFSKHGALQLLCDFAHVSEWLGECGTISHEMRSGMLKNEVLRRCEGVGRLLLRSPGEHIKMNEECNKKTAEKSADTTELMPAEMYVPNQEQWLDLRANKGLLFKPPFCCSQLSK